MKKQTDDNYVRVSIPLVITEPDASSKDTQQQSSVQFPDHQPICVDPSVVGCGGGVEEDDEFLSVVVEAEKVVCEIVSAAADEDDDPGGLNDSFFLSHTFSEDEIEF